MSFKIDKSVIDRDTVQRNMMCREEAELWLSKIESISPCKEEKRFWEELIKLAGTKLGKPVELPKPEEMSDEEAIKFEKRLWPRGMHCDEEIGRTSTEYISRWIDGDDFTKQLKKYVASRRFKERQRREHD